MTRAGVAGDAALDQAIGVALRGVHFGVLAGVLEALVPAEVCELLATIKSHRENGLPISK